jgi:signal transduction histidine kinase
MGGDGRIWLATLGGTVWLDPKNLRQNQTPPPVVVAALTANGTRILNPKDVALPKRTTTVQIDFAALSLSIPTRNQFRYRMEGVDSGWVDPHGRRQAFYTNLEAGDYVFQVIASNGDGVWNREGATLRFTIAPTFLETRWFAVLCILAMCGLLWGAYHVRVRQVTRRLHAASEVRVAERERIARELHDTLLQAFQGLVLRFQSVADRIPAEQPVRPLIEDALERADAALIEGRDRVRELRGTNIAADVSQELRRVASEQAAHYPTLFSLTTTGRPLDLQPVAREEIVRIGEEAIRNAFQHAEAAHVEAALVFGTRAFVLRR